MTKTGLPTLRFDRNTGLSTFDNHTTAPRGDHEEKYLLGWGENRPVVKSCSLQDLTTPWRHEHCGLYDLLIVAVRTTTVSA